MVACIHSAIDHSEGIRFYFVRNLGFPKSFTGVVSSVDRVSDDHRSTVFTLDRTNMIRHSIIHCIFSVCCLGR